MHCCSYNCRTPVIYSTIYDARDNGWSAFCMRFWMQFMMIILLALTIIFLIVSYSTILIIFDFEGLLASYMSVSEKQYKLGLFALQDIINSDDYGFDYLIFVYILIIVVSPAVTIGLLIV